MTGRDPVTGNVFDFTLIFVERTEIHELLDFFKPEFRAIEIRPLEES
jgi:hypothetical protein